MEISHMAPRKLLVTSCLSWYLGRVRRAGQPTPVPPPSSHPLGQSLDCREQVTLGTQSNKGTVVGGWLASGADSMGQKAPTSSFPAFLLLSFLCTNPKPLLGHLPSCLVMGQRGIQVRVDPRVSTHVHMIPFPKTDIQTDADTGGHRHQKWQRVEVRIRVRHWEELPNPVRP